MRVLEEHTEQIEADFQDIGIELADLFRGRLTWRRFGVLLRQLPRTSRFARALDPAAAWSIGEHLQALTLDALNGANWQRSRSRRKAPEPIKRPGATSAKDQQIAALSEQLVRRRSGRREP